MIPAVESLLWEWAYWSLHGPKGMGYAGESIEYRLMREHGRRTKEKVRVMASVFKRKVKVIEDGEEREKWETPRQMVPQAVPKSSSYARWDGAFLWPPAVDKANGAINALPPEQKSIVQVHYLAGGKIKQRIEASGLKKSRYYELLDLAHSELERKMWG